MENKGFKVSQYACAVLLIVSSIALVAYQVIEIDDVATGLLYYVAQSFLLAGSIFGLDHYIKIINKNYHERNSKWRPPLPAISFGSIITANLFEDKFQETPWRGMADELQELHYLKGAKFINQLKLIIYYGEYHLVEGETNIYSAISEQSDDFDNLINAARKAVEHGYRVYILPNPKGIRTADFIFERKGVYKLFDLKTITGKNSVENRLSDSVGQTNRVLLHMTADYNPGTLARSIKRYFELNPYAREVLVYKGKKQISITRKSLEDTNFFRTFIRRYTKWQKSHAKWLFV